MVDEGKIKKIVLPRLHIHTDKQEKWRDTVPREITKVIKSNFPTYQQVQGYFSARPLKFNLKITEGGYQYKFSVEMETYERRA